MRALTLTQPWATLVARGEKSIETRSWRAPAGAVGERIAIHAGAGLGPVGGKRGLRALLERHPFSELIGSVDELPLGAIVATARIAWCKPTSMVGFTGLPRHEEWLGDYTIGRWAWGLESVRALERPVTIKGALGVWKVPSELLEELRS